ncbi:adenine-specific methyltransferase EcoRI family protein [Acidithiobacillus sp. IBUN Pt1247-S3]|uniref:adenine-specific methyltransferase EcoRI family protein n=1 Tax=Acidithiobacillus sp. IBUN Pt1247-S3 TaxID=3166642 RepID=UPI0034E61717
MTKAKPIQAAPNDSRGESRNSSLQAARRAKQDEFYTQYIDIQKEIEAYLEFNLDTFRDKIVYCNCDDPFESNFFKYFAANFNKLGLKKLITTSYDGSPIASAQLPLIEYTEGNGKRQKPKAIAVILDHVKDEDGDGAANIDDVKLFLKRNKAARKALKDDGEYSGGDFRSAECVALLKEADIINVTNPPFSLFREYVAQLVEHEKKFVIIGPKNATTYKDVFPLIKETKLWLGSGFANGNAYFSIPAGSGRDFADGVYDASTGLVKFRNVGWFTNLDHGRRHKKLPLMTMADNLKFSKHKEIKGKAAYDRYDNYDAIEVPFIDAIPSDYDGVIGVPITFLDKHNPEQFEILGATESEGKGFSNGLWRGGVAQAMVRGARVYKRLFIRRKDLA